MRLILLITLSVVTVFNVLGQTTIPTGTDNRSCQDAFLLCDLGIINQRFSESPCGSISPFYYLINFNLAGTNSIVLNPTTLNGSYSYYGPFNSALDACAASTPNQTGNLSNFSSITLSNQAGFYLLAIEPIDCQGTLNFTITEDAGLDCSPVAPSPEFCETCITSFSPTPGQYMVSAWVKMENAPFGTLTYTEPSLNISFLASPSTFNLIPSGQIIDGWQKIEARITVPLTATGINIELDVTSGVAFFDDIRFYPFDGSMMSYVYDPISLRLMAELDERNYATLYEYDEEGKLVRVKKETERGVMTIQENRDNIKKR